MAWRLWRQRRSAVCTGSTVRKRSDLTWILFEHDIIGITMHFEDVFAFLASSLSTLGAFKSTTISHSLFGPMDCLSWAVQIGQRETKSGYSITNDQIIEVDLGNSRRWSRDDRVTSFC